MSKDLKFICDCGNVSGHIANYQQTDKQHLTCYCLYCQGIHRYLNSQETELDENGGTHVIHIHPTQMHFAQGLNFLKSIQLANKPSLRWYASCCNTLIATSTTTPKLPFISVSTCCLKAEQAQGALGPVSAHIHLEHASGNITHVKDTEIKISFILRKILKNAVVAFFKHSKRQNPLFDSLTKSPIATPYKLNLIEQQKIGIASLPKD